jgi:hypothetical protein
MLMGAHHTRRGPDPLPLPLGAARLARRRRLVFELLEGRRLLALTVNTLADEFDGSVGDGDVSLRDAIAAATSGETIEFSVTGIIQLDGSLGQLEIDKDLTILGPGAGLLSIDAQGNSRVALIAGEITVDLRGITLTGGSADQGGGLRVTDDATATLTDMIVQASTATTSRYDAGGGIYNRGILTIVGSTVTGNRATVGSGSGAGIWNGGKLVIARSTISGNAAVQDGGGLYSETADEVTITESSFTNNSAGDDGGGLFVLGGITRLTNSTISGNMAQGDDGGGIWSASGDLIVSNSTLVGNSALDEGGGVFRAYSGEATFRHSTVTANTAARGGGLRAGTGTTTLSHTLVVGNLATTASEIRRSGGTVNLNDYNLLGDSSKTTAAALSGVTAGATDILATSNGTLPTAWEAILDVGLANHGGPTLTHALPEGSPALDGGNPIASPGVGSVPLFDQRGDNFGRVQNGRIDIGAYEQGTVPAADFDSDGSVTGVDFLRWQRGFGTQAPDATKAQGDSDDDRDVDASDWHVWEIQFGPPSFIATQSTAVTQSSAATRSADAPQAFFVGPGDLGLGVERLDLQPARATSWDVGGHLDAGHRPSASVAIESRVPWHRDASVPPADHRTHQAASSRDEVFAVLGTASWGIEPLLMRSGAPWD